MFKFNINYLETGYHKEGDKPFFFPPIGIDDVINGNLVEIEGRNGTGKTTLLNVLALALGYLDQETSLETKPALKQKLNKLNENDTLEYNFTISCQKPSPIELKLERTKGKNFRCWLNSRPIDLDKLNQKFDILFLTEDDPKKVVNASIGKLNRYFNDLEKGTRVLQKALMNHLQDNVDFREFKEKEEQLLGDIETYKKTIIETRKKFKILSEKLDKIKMKDEIREKLRLLSDKTKITNNYNTVKRTFDELNSKKDTNIVRSLYLERSKLSCLTSDIKKINNRIKQICDSLREYGTQIDEKKLQNNDYCELNALNERIHPMKLQKTIKMQMINEFLELLHHHSNTEIVPIIGKTVADTRKELFKIKASLATDRIFGLSTALNQTMAEKKKATIDYDKKLTKISGLVEKNKAIGDLDVVQKEFLKVEEKYLDLLVVLDEDRNKLLAVWETVSLVEGDSEELQEQLRDLEIDIGTQETLCVKYQEKVAILKTDSIGEPKYFKNEQKINELYQTVFALRGKTSIWNEILRNPEIAKEQFAQDKEEKVFGKNEYLTFFGAVGEYLGSQFEPIPYDYKQHNIKFFDIEHNFFITTEDRKIHIANLSQGQSKITSLTGSFRKMDPNKKKIVLIDEISELDPHNLEDVKRTLKEKLDEGTLLLAILVRPSLEIIQIGKWD